MRRTTPIAVLSGILAAGLAMSMPQGKAADNSPLPPQTPSHQTVPEDTAPGKSGSSTGPLSDKLNQSGGVINPPAGIDRDMTQSPPPEGRTPVIPPPGTPGGKSGVEPK